MSEQPLVKELKKSSLYGDAEAVATKLIESGFKALLAGGAVRDALLGRPIKDMDLATSALPHEVEALFPDSIAIGKAFGVIGVKINSEIFEVATFRQDGDYQDGRRPQSIEFSSIIEDSKRRDFTINALYFDFETKKVVDLQNGQADLKNKMIRTVGDPKKRFNEDHLRILRALRFQSVLGFEIEPQTLRAIYEQSSLLENIARERITVEFEKLLMGQNFLLALKVSKDSGVFETLTQFTLTEKTIHRLAMSSEDLISRLSVLLFDQDPKLFFKRFRFSNQIASSVMRVLSLSQTLQKDRLGQKLKALGDPWGLHALSLLQSVRWSENQHSDDLDRLVKTLVQWGGSLPKPLLRSEDLIKLEMKTDQNFGKILNTCFIAQLEGQIKTQQEAINFAVEWDPKSS